MYCSFLPNYKSNVEDNIVIIAILPGKKQRLKTLRNVKVDK